MHNINSNTSKRTLPKHMLNNQDGSNRMHKHTRKPTVMRNILPRNRKFNHIYSPLLHLMVEQRL